MEKPTIQIDSSKPEYKAKCEQYARDHIPFDLGNFDINIKPMVEFCHRIATTHFYELKVLREQPNVCHFIPREQHGVVPVEFSGEPED